MPKCSTPVCARINSRMALIFRGGLDQTFLFDGENVVVHGVGYPWKFGHLNFSPMVRGGKVYVSDNNGDIKIYDIKQKFWNNL